MAEKIKEKNIPEEKLDEDTGEETDSAVKDEKPVEAKKRSGKKVWIPIIILIILLGISGLGKIYAPERFSFLSKTKFTTTEIKVDEDNLSEELLSPFFIPPGLNDDTIRIDLSVIWDGLASVRFKKKELGLRNMMYEKFFKIAEQNPDLNQKITYMENEVSSMLRNALGVQNLEVKIKEIRYF